MVVPALFHLEIKNSTLFLRDLKLKKVLAFLSKLRNFKNLHISYQSDYFKKQLLKIFIIFKAITAKVHKIFIMSYNTQS